MDGIAVIGMAGKFPGCETIQEYWEKITKGEELLTRFSEEELKTKGVEEELLQNKLHVKANGLINSAETFDASFFNMTPREADLTDPQHRKFLEICYEALENSGTSPDKYAGSIGVFAGCSMNNYLLKNLFQYPELLESIGEFQTIVNNDKDFLTTKVSYKLNLTGPSYDIQTACSTSLVAIHNACQNLLSYQCDVALGGGAFIMNPRGEGYMYKPGGIESPDGICRPFDRDANGTVFGEGVGVVVLKRLEDAIEDKDHILAVIKSTALNNDGINKVGYMAPGIEGQTEVIRMAHQFAEIDPSTISYIETHGTGTNLGDPIEITALTNAFREHTEDKNFCAIGSVKGNIGHCDVAAGVAGLIKTILALNNKLIPPSINFDSPNPELDIENSPFYVNTSLSEWKTNGAPRRAAVSSFGIGGTNAHCILEEWEGTLYNVEESKDQGYHILPLSAKTDKALSTIANNLGKALKDSPVQLEDVAFTLQNGRNDYQKRAVVFGRNTEDVSNAVNENKIIKGALRFENPSIFFMFTGQGSQYLEMGKGLYEQFELFKNIIDTADEILTKEFDISVIALLYNYGNKDESKSIINETANTQPLLYVIQYATACLLTEFGIYPNALIGHSIGEITAAAFSGVFSFEDGLRLVAQRGKIMQQQPSGSMMSVNMPANKLRGILTEGIELSLINAPNYSVVSGSDENIQNFFTYLQSNYKDIHATVLKTSHAFHSSLMDGALEPFGDFLQEIEFNSPEIPMISNISGTWLEDDEAASPSYWVKHIRTAVNFSDGIETLMTNDGIFLEVGPGNMLSMLASQNSLAQNSVFLQTMRHPQKPGDDSEVLLTTIGNYWIAGGNINWEDQYAEMQPRKIPLPTYPFEQKRHWLEQKNRTQTFVTQSIDIEEISINTEKEDDLLESGYHERPNLSTKYKEPSTENEKVLVGIWQKLLGIKGIGINDDFFELGGHSLLASQTMVRINENFKTELPLESLFATPTIQDFVKKHSLSNQVREKEKVFELAEQNTYPLSIEQRRLWILNEIEGDNPAYNIPFSYRIKGDFNLDIYRKSLELLVKKHPVLNTNIIQQNDEPICKIIQRSIHVNYVDISKSSKEDTEKEIQLFIKDETRKSFNLKSDPLYRFNVIQKAEGDVILHFVIHHIIFDGWSWGIFADELSQIYNELSIDADYQPEIPEYNYFNFCLQQKNAPKEISQESIQFWKEQMEGAPAEIDFPFDNLRPEEISGYGCREEITIDEEITTQLKGLSKDQNSTLYMTMLTAYGLLMRLYSNQSDVCIGTPTANRNNSKHEDVIGFFVNTIVMRLRLDQKKSFKEHLADTRNVVLKSLNHQEVGFEKLVEILQPDRQVNVNPIYQVMFAWLNAPRNDFHFGNAACERLTIQEGISPQDITFYMWEEKGRIVGEIEFNSDILKRESVLHFKNNFIQLLKEVVTSSEQSIGALHYISPYTQKYLDEINNTKTTLPEALVQDMFIKKVSEYSGKPAVISNNVSLTYRELDILSNQLANKLAKTGIGKGDVVGISMNRSVNLLVAVLGVLKSGACYLPLDPDFPADRLNYMLEDSGASLLISETDIIKIYDSYKKERLLLNNLEVLKDEQKDFVIKSKDEQSLAYILYTSGSTGKPKGVMVHHEAVVNFINSMAKEPGLKSDDVLLAVTTLSFDISVLELFLPLAVGATIILTSSEDKMDAEQLSLLIERYKVNTLQATPATWNMLLSGDWAGNNELKALCGGEALPPSLAEKLIPKVKELWNMYGPTETTVWSTCQKVENSTPPILVGKPIDNTDILILNDENILLPVGVIGEVCIGGLGVTKGYHNRPELTSEKFIDFKGEIIYKTGDNGRILSNGNIEILGRRDNQLKLRGFRIEPGEIEAQLCRIDGVKEAVVKVHKFSDIDERLVAFAVVEGMEEIDKEIVRSTLSKNLPVYMVPSLYKFSTDFPRTPNGKIDRKKLIYTLKDDDTQYNEEENEQINNIEEDILAVWQKQLKIKQINISEDFFSLGGSSLLAINLLNEIEKRYSCKISFRDFLAEYNSVQKMALFIGSTQEKSKTVKKVNDKSKYEHMFCFSSLGSKPPVFAIYCDKVFSNNNVIKSEHPIYSFVWPGVDGKEFEFTTVEEVASAYLKQIRNAQPKEPYYLVGYSFGGYVAYEIAVMLQKKLGQKSVVVLLDTGHPQVKFTKRDKFLRKKEINGYFYAMMDFYFLRGFRFFSEKYHKAVRNIKKRLNYKFTGDEINEIIFRFAWNTGTKYSPEYFDGDVILFKTYENPVRDPDLGWRNSVKKITTFNIPGDHGGILREEEVQLYISEKLSEYFNS